MYRLNYQHYFYHLFIIISIFVAWIVCLLNWNQIACWLCNVAESHPITSAYLMQVLDHCLIGFRDILQVNCWSFSICFLSQLQLSLFLWGTNVWYNDVTGVHLPTCAVLVANEEDSYVEVRLYLESHRLTLSVITRFSNILDQCLDIIIV